MRVCKRVFYRGTVQGVGFRMTTKRIADRFAVVGFVRNLPDGQVEVVVAGASAEVERFLAAVDQRMGSYIQGHRVEDASDEPFADFAIRI